IDLARHAESLGLERYWLAEHHNAGSLACSAPEIMIGQVAAATRTLRVGAGARLGVLRFARGPRDLPRASVGAGRQYTPTEEDALLLEAHRGRILVGEVDELRARIVEMAEEAQADEIMITTNIHDHGARKRSYELFADALC